MGECLWILGRLQDALPVFEESYTQFEGLKNQVEAGAIQRLIGRIYWELGDRNRSLSYYNKALTILEAIPESVELAWAVSSISQMHMLASEYEEAVSHGLRAIALAEKLGANDVRVHAATNVGAAYMSTGNIEAGEAMLRTSIDEGIELNLPHDACLALLGLGEGLSRLDRYAEALDVLKRLSVYAERIQVPLFGGSAVMELMRLDWLLGNWRAALNRRQQIFEWIERGQGMNYVLVFSHNLFAQMYSDLGQPKQAAQALRQIAEQVLGRGEMQSTGPYLAQVTRTQSSLGAKKPMPHIEPSSMRLMLRHRFTPRSVQAPCFHLSGLWRHERRRMI
ncbi:tetratricopeptide repeat protein [Chloroflexi bacterium TSY]|nr:tetratricopeptide repeat protein [Chloroflexi bacterium TSY]